MKFLILTQYFPPDTGGAATRLHSLAAELSRAGHEVEVVTALPNYPQGRILQDYAACFYRRERREGVTVHRVWLYASVGGGPRRMLSYLSFALTSFFGLFRAQKPDYLFVESPPLFLSVPALVACRSWNVPFVFNVADLWPDVITDGGFLRDGLVVRCMRTIERWSYQRASYVTAVTEGIRDALLRQKHVPPEKILFLPNGADTVRFKPQPSSLQLKTQLGLEGKRIVLWAGTLGTAHGLEYVLQAAKMLEERPEIHFLFVGTGSVKSKLVQLREAMRLRNVTFCEPVSLEQLPPYFSIAEIGLASLINIPIYEGARPSKIFPILASGKPIIFAGAGETARLIQQARAGIVTPPEDPVSLANATLHLIENPALSRELGENGRRFVETNFQWSRLVDNWVSQLRAPLTRSNGTTGAAQQIGATIRGERQ